MKMGRCAPDPSMTRSKEETRMGKTMKQQVMLAPATKEKPAEIVFRDVEIPEPVPGQVLIKIK